MENIAAMHTHTPQECISAPKVCKGGREDCDGCDFDSYTCLQHAMLWGVYICTAPLGVARGLGVAQNDEYSTP
jgi:hypothetical protein